MTPDLDAPLFEDTLTPHRSLGRKGFRTLMIAACSATTALSVPFYLVGAWPIVGFLGLDALAIYVAFRVNYRSGARLRTFPPDLFRAPLRPRQLRRPRREWRFAPAWVRLERVDDEEYGPQRLTLVSRGKSWQIGRHVGPERKAQFAGELARALVEARRGPRYS